MDREKDLSPRSSLETVTEDLYLPSRNLGGRWREQRSRIVAWAPITISWLISVSLFLCLMIKDSTCISRQDAVSYWKPFEFQPFVGPPLPATYEAVFFDATLKYNETHQIYRPSTKPEYVGRPTPEMDRAWDDLIGSINVFLTPEEAQTVGEDMYIDPDTGLHMAQVSVFHNIHCLNMIRQRLHVDEYPEIQDYTLDVHVEHCIDNIRLALMCSADMTMIPIEWSANRNHSMARFETFHTCRNYDGLKEWAISRDSADMDRYMQNAANLHRQMGH